MLPKEFSGLKTSGEIAEDMETASVSPDGHAGSLSHRDLVFSKSPSEWLRLCHIRAMAAEQKFAHLQAPPDQQALVAGGMTACQAQHYLRAWRNAVQRKASMLKWNTSMPPLLRQSFGLLGHPPQGLRIPLPSPSAILPSLPARRPPGAQWAGESLTWLQENHPHALDAQIEFQEEGHLYFVDGIAMELSVTGLIGK